MIAPDDKPATAEEQIAAGKVLAIHLPLKRDEDEADAPPLRRAFLYRVCRLEELTFRRDMWAIDELGVSVAADGAWRVRVVAYVIDRDTFKVGRTESNHEFDERDGNQAPPTLRTSLAKAVQRGLVDHFEHEVAENLYYKGERILDPHGELDDVKVGKRRRR